MVVALSLVYGLVVVALVGGGLWITRQAALETARAQAVAITTFSAAYTARMYDLGDQVATTLAEEFSGRPLDPDAVSLAIVQAAERTAQNDYIVVVDAQGRVIAASEPMRLQLPARADALIAHQNGADLFIGQVVRSRLTQDIIYRVSRRVRTADGEFGGYVSVAIRPFGVQPASARRARDPQVSVWSDDGRFIAATFVDFDADGSALAPQRLRDLGQSAQGRAIDRDGLIHAEARVDGLPLVVSTDFDADGVLSPWRQMLPLALAVAGLLLLLGGAFAWAGRRAARTEAAARFALEKARAEAETNLRGREMLLKEVHHRVRNSLMLVSSFLMLQARSADAKTRSALERIQARVISIGVVHETLYAGSDLGLIDMDEYLGRLLPELGAGLGIADRGISLHCRVEDVTAPSEQATTVGLIVSEAVTNAVKYAFGEAGGTITVSARRLDDSQVELVVADDGKGVSAEPKAGLGSELLQALAHQLGGRVTVHGGAGATVRVVFPLRTA